MLRFKQFLFETYDPFAMVKRDWSDRPVVDKNYKLIFVEPEKVLKAAGVGIPPNQERFNYWSDILRKDPNNINIEPAKIAIDSDGTVYISDGRHRLSAAKEVGLKTFPATMHIGDLKNIEMVSDKIGKVVGKGENPPIITNTQKVKNVGAAGLAAAGSIVGSALTQGVEAASNVLGMVGAPPAGKDRMQIEKTFNSDIGLGFDLTPEGELEMNPAGREAVRKRQQRGINFPSMFQQ